VQFDIGPAVLGLLFLLMSAFYAVFSPIWGWIADRMVFCIMFFMSFKTTIVSDYDDENNSNAYHRFITSFLHLLLSY